ncbi:transposon, En/Spm-like protein [Tanacetum coccineum]|uniref:Transposon, En/Spm-like protein n=1 Tax=Tanacetum coccineum TaxID=301880 RepID=A0ABQ5DYH9_9ASTR
MFICNAVMTIDKSWTTISNRNSEEFLDGLFAFIKHCKPLLHPITQKIHCPCSRCCNRDDNRVTLEILEVHISRYGFDQHYTTWKYHGEPILPLPPPVPHSPEHVDMDTFFEDISANNVPTPPTQTTGPQPSQTTGPNNEFEELLSRSTQKLYPGCDMSTLEFTTEISHIKALHKITDAGFNKILALLQKACPPSKGYNFPSSYYEIKKTYKKIGLGYESIHAYINDCFLFWGLEENLKMPNCPVCKKSRYKKKTKAGKLVAKMIVHYFPLTPRLQRMFNTKHIAKWMTWHATGQSKEKGKMNHPCDGRAWKYFDMMKPEFSGDPRNVRLGLAADGFNPFGMMSQNYSMWPVILTTYNTPPWMCMKETSLMLTMLIPGPRSPAKDIDVYLQPLIKELQELWKGVWTKDAATGTHFQMKAAVLWTINDFPAQINDKTKDTVKARQDLETLKVRKELWLVKKPNGKLEKPHPKYSFTTEGRKRFCKFIKGVRLPDGFGSNFKQKVTADDNNITGMKSHDCHIMMHRLLPYGVQQYLPKSIAAPIIEFCLFFKQLCARTLMQQDMSEAKKQSISILIELEQIFPPAFFDIMIHVAIHLPDEAILGGPIRYRWMFPFERYMKKLKNYVRNKAKPEGSIAEGYVAEEALTFCSRYLKDDVETRFNRLGRNDDGLPEEEPNKFQKNRLLHVETYFPPGYHIAEFRFNTMGMNGEMYYGSIEESGATLISAKPLSCLVSMYKFCMTEVDAVPFPVNDDNANANEGKAREDDFGYGRACKNRKLPGGGSTSRRRGPQAFPDVISREEMDRILRQRDQEAELLRKQTAEATTTGLFWLAIEG